MALLLRRSSALAVAAARRAPAAAASSLRRRAPAATARHLSDASAVDEEAQKAAELARLDERAGRAETGATPPDASRRRRQPSDAAKIGQTVPFTAESSRNSRRLRAERSKSVTPPHVAVVPDGISPGLPEHPDEVAALMRIPEVWRPSGPVPDVSRSSRGAAAAGTRIFRGDESRRRRGRNADIPRRRVAGAPRLGRGYSAVTRRRHANAARRSSFSEPRPAPAE